MGVKYRQFGKELLEGKYSNVSQYQGSENILTASQVEKQENDANAEINQALIELVIVCPNCGSDIDPDKDYCDKCGAKVD
ncbi:MAG: zinc-ribbon domain-containing protein [Candidatus Helarchaeota archaeon]